MGSHWVCQLLGTPELSQGQPAAGIEKLNLARSLLSVFSHLPFKALFYPGKARWLQRIGVKTTKSGLLSGLFFPFSKSISLQLLVKVPSCLKEA